MTNHTCLEVAKVAMDGVKPEAQALMTPAAAGEVAGSEQAKDHDTSFVAPFYDCLFALFPDVLSKYIAWKNITGIECGTLAAMMSSGVTFAGEMDVSSAKVISKALNQALTPAQVERARRRLLDKGVIVPLDRLTTKGTTKKDRPNKGHVASYRIAAEIWNTVELPGREAYNSQAKNMKRRRGGVLVTGAAKVTRYASGKYTAVPLGLAVEMAARKLGSCATHVLILIMKALNADGRAWIEKVRYGELPIDTRRLRDGLGELLHSSKDFNALIIEETINGETYYRIAPDIWATIPRKKSSPKAVPQAEGDNWQNDPIYKERVTAL